MIKTTAEKVGKENNWTSCQDLNTIAQLRLPDFPWWNYNFAMPCLSVTANAHAALIAFLLAGLPPWGKAPNGSSHSRVQVD